MEIHANGEALLLEELAIIASTWTARPLHSCGALTGTSTMLTILHGFERFSRGLDGAGMLVDRPALPCLSALGEGAEVEARGEDIVLVLDLAPDSPLPMNEVEALLPRRRARRTLRATELGVRPAHRGDVDFHACADTVRKMAEAVRGARRDDAPAPRVYVVGRAPLPVFAHLGMELSSWADITLLNRRQSGHWDVLPLQAPALAEDEPFFRVRGLDAACSSIANGWVAVFLSINHPTPRDGILSFFEERDEKLAGIVEIRAERGREALLDAASAPQAMREIARILGRIPAVRYPRAKRLALFIAGPATLAFMAGRAVPPDVFRSVRVPSYYVGGYRAAIEVP